MRSYRWIAVVGAVLAAMVWAGPASAFLFLHVSDVHVDASGKTRFGSDGQERLKEVLAMLPVLQPKFALVTGDITEACDLPSLRLYAGLVKGAPCPFYSVTGNHDAGFTPEAWRETLGSGHFSFDCEECTVIGLNTEHPWPAWGDFLEERLKEAKARGQKEFLLGFHRPLILPSFDSGDIMPGYATLSGEQGLRVANLCAQYGVKAALAGHFHPPYDAYQILSGTLSLATPALVGTPGKGAASSFFRIFSLEKGVLAWADASPGTWPVIAVIAPERTAAWSPVAARDGEEKLVVKPLSPDPITKVTWALPDGEAAPMAPCGDGRYEAVLKVGNEGARRVTLKITATDAAGRSATLAYPVLTRPAAAK